MLSPGANVFIWAIFYFEDPCPAQFSYVPGAFKCYLTSEKQSYTWQQADAECKSRDGGLVALETQEEFDATKEWYMGSEFHYTRFTTKILYRQCYCLCQIYIIRYWVQLFNMQFISLLRKGIRNYAQMDHIHHLYIFIYTCAYVHAYAYNYAYTYICIFINIYICLLQTYINW